MLGSIGMGELLVILVIVLVLFGSSRIPQLMGGLGEGLKNFKKAMRDENDKDSHATKETIDSKEKVIK